METIPYSNIGFCLFQYSILLFAEEKRRRLDVSVFLL